MNKELNSVFIIAEAGVNHNGSIKLAKQLIDVAAKAGATYVSPFAGRLDDIGHDGMELISQIRQIYDNYGLKTKILAASLRHPKHILDSALIGADVVTVPPATLEKLFNHPLTDKGIAQFLKDAKEWAK